jgi:hypothetical protein
MLDISRQYPEVVRGYNRPPKMFSVCILSIDYNKNTQNSKKIKKSGYAIVSKCS